MRIRNIFHGIGGNAERHLDKLTYAVGKAAEDAREDAIRHIRKMSTGTTIVAAVIGFAIRHLIG